MEPQHITPQLHSPPKRYIPVLYKFWFSQTAAFLWVIFSFWLSLPWLSELGSHITIPFALLLIAGISYIPGYFNAFMATSLLFDRQPPFSPSEPIEAIKILIACRNEANRISDTLLHIAQQDYAGPIQIILVDNGSTDETAFDAAETARKAGLHLKLVSEPRAGKHNALNRALPFIETRLFVSLDADTLLHRSAIRFIVSRMLTAPVDVAAIAGTVLVRNSRTNLLTNMQEWDYFLGIANIKRLQGLYQSTLVAQGAFSLIRTDLIRELGGWPDAIGEDIVLTWMLLAQKKRIFFEPLAVAFTDVPDRFRAFFRQRSRWARGMIEALKRTGPWKQPSLFPRILTSYNVMMPPSISCIHFAGYQACLPLSLAITGSLAPIRCSSCRLPFYKTGSCIGFNATCFGRSICIYDVTVSAFFCTSSCTRC